MSKENKVTWRDLHDAHQNDLKRIYKLNDRQLENAVRSHYYGANAAQRRQLYQTVYGKREK